MATVNLATQHTVARALAGEISRRYNLNTSGMHLAAEKVKYDVDTFVKEHFPSGSGFDAGTKLDWGRSTPKRMVFTTSFHHMDEHGGYCGWTEHDVIVTPDFIQGFEVRVTGRELKRGDDIKDYIHQVFCPILYKEVGAYTISPVRAAKQTQAQYDAAPSQGIDG